MMSDANSPTQLGSLLLKSPLLPMSQILNNSSANNTSSNTPKERRFTSPSLNEDASKPPFKSPTMPLPSSPSFQNQQTPMLSPSPPLPPPPPTPPAETLNSEPLPSPPVLVFAENQSSSTFKTNLDKFNTTNRVEQKPASNLVARPKTSTSSLIESLTARLNLMRSGEANEKTKSASLNNSFSSSNSAQAGIGSIFKNPLVCKTPSVNKPAQAEAKPAKAKNQWTNFSLYGLDNEDEHDSNRRRSSSCGYAAKNEPNEPTELKNLYPNLSQVEYDFDESRYRSSLHQPISRTRSTKSNRKLLRLICRPYHRRSKKATTSSHLLQLTER